MQYLCPSEPRAYSCGRKPIVREEKDYAKHCFIWPSGRRKGNAKCPSRSVLRTGSLKYGRHFQVQHKGKHGAGTNGEVIHGSGAAGSR